MSIGPKKFGAFPGVFTPSILTILGVIMYMRLGWVTGVAGLWGTVAIILLAHVISITTGLSISSIATDKKIKAGGIYYILSRSLGLPMGGSIGITLFVGTALSISLYIVGFTENFLSLDAITTFLGIEHVDTNSIRMVGSAVLLSLVIIAMISTSFAIKAQFFILAAIFLSLVSIVVGLISGAGISGSSIAVTTPPFSNFSFELVFAIFFPAVTGFTAGVAMSGDLKDPKRDIPRGTMMAILSGFIIYMTLAFAFYFFVDQDLLVGNYNFLMVVSAVPVLVVAGIWGATLSSALGGILGGPRIIQAIALDRIVPRIIGRGHGKNNEPRNALIFTFLISEIGILIGDLNMIASIVSMFYLMAYGFINLSFSLEKWASTDFRPSFSIPVWVGIIGFLASFIIMFKLDLVAMVVALIILGIVYYFINKKQLHLDMGDVWLSVRASILRKMLSDLNRKGLTERNWRPNILLFSGGNKSRPYLLAFGKYLVAEQGMISNFDLIFNKSHKVLFPKHNQALPESESLNDEGVFSRRQECNNVYRGIENISATYGFSGVEPNTVVLGWGRKTDHPQRFARMLRFLSDLDLNIVLLDYDPIKGFGSKRQIDIWLRGGSNNGNLMLSLIKFIKISFPWHNATTRLMIINSQNDSEQQIIGEANQMLDNMRIDAEIIIINNEINKKPVNVIIKEESANADLTFLGMAEVEEGKELEFIERADNLYKDLGTVAIVKASSFFSELTIGL